jgi:DNA-directed RNA polymerase subunit L
VISLFNYSINKKDENTVEIVFENIEYSILNELRERMLENEDVVFASVVEEHPEKKNLIMKIKTKSKDPLTYLKKAAKELSKDIEKLSKEIE